MRRRSVARRSTTVLIFACFLSLYVAPPRAVADEDLAWKGTVSFHWKAAATDTAAGTTSSADWSGTWTIKRQLPPEPGQPAHMVRVLAELTLKGTSTDTRVSDCDPNDPVPKDVSARTTTAVATLTDELTISTPTPNEAFLDWEPSGQPMHGKYSDVETGCDGKVYTTDTPFGFPSPGLHIRVPVSAGRVAHGNATITYDANGSGVNIPPQLGNAPKTSSDVGWDLTGGSQHHYVIEIRSWIPHQRAVHPFFPAPSPWQLSQGSPLVDLSPNCWIPPEDEQAFTFVSATFRGDGHKGFDGTYRLADRIEFDYDGQSISNFTVTPGFAHVGATHEDKRYTVVGMADPHPAQECTRVRTAPDRSAATASGRTFQVSYRGSIPLVPAAPDIVHAIDGLLRDNGTIAIKYTVTNFPSSGLRVTRDGVEIANVMTNDASCLPEASVQGYGGAARLFYGLTTTRTGAFDIDYRSPARQTIQSALCSGLWSP